MGAYGLPTPGPLKEGEKVQYEIINEWQLCPKCNGHGVIHFITMDMHSIDTKSKPCDLCNGKKIISKLTGLPPA